ncbi:EAL domain-containing protein [Sphingomonas sp. GC_Shp_3]|uniref:putative bifunctional diguanylate cyclase/phosphodiesterase n=1 Tax=Sphingomonas sp. GC_Shp_3 TaxID=2937383 RepID=UPI00226A54A5
MRLIAALLIPVLTVALGLTIFAFSALRGAASQADRVSVNRQEQEVKLAINDALDELAQSQAGVAIWSPLVLELRKPHPNWGWVDDNVGVWLNYVFAHDVDIILNADDKAVYVMRDGVRATPVSFAAYARAAQPLIEAARGRTHEAPNPHERLPGRALSATSTVRTSTRSIHATDLGVVMGRPAAMSVMRLIPDTSKVAAAPGREPLLVSIRYLDAGFTQNLVKLQSITGARIQRSHQLKPSEHGVTLVSSRGGNLGFFVWRPDRPGRAVWSSMAPSAGAALVALLAALGVLLFSVAKLMRKDAVSLRQLAAAHVELQAKEAQAHHLAYHDVLTGLPNRAHINAVIDHKVSDAHAERLWAVLLVDLDRFKQVNDTLGHAGGDQLIQLVSARLRGLINPGDVVARLGGDEFAILLDDRLNLSDIEETAQAMVDAVREPFAILGTSVFIGASIGIACAQSCRSDRAELMRMADIAMYRAKAEGRDGYRLFSTGMDESVKMRRGLEYDLRDALARKQELFVNYQPQMDGTGTQIIGLEALLRWQHPVRGLLSPDAFIPIAEETGLICELGHFVLRDACDVARAWPSLSVAVNLSPVQFRSGDLAAEIRAIVQESGARPAQIELEVTESVLLDNDAVVRAVLAELRSAGFRIALDDFGTGYSSLSYLSKFQVDKIKIDRSFTSRLGEVDDAAAIIHAVVRLGHAMGLSVSAEGVETREQRAFLEGAGCNELQGFLFSEALPPASLAQLMKRLRYAA